MSEQNQPMEIIENQDFHTIYYGQAKPNTWGVKPTLSLAHGSGRLLAYPFLYIGNWIDGKMKGDFNIYYQDNCQYGELFNYEKHRQGQKNRDFVMYTENATKYPLNIGFRLLNQKCF